MKHFGQSLKSCSCMWRSCFVVFRVGGHRVRSRSPVPFCRRVGKGFIIALFRDLWPSASCFRRNVHWPKFGYKFTDIRVRRARQAGFSKCLSRISGQEFISDLFFFLLLPPAVVLLPVGVLGLELGVLASQPLEFGLLCKG